MKPLPSHLHCVGGNLASQQPSAKISGCWSGSLVTPGNRKGPFSWKLQYTMLQRKSNKWMDVSKQHTSSQHCSIAISAHVPLHRHNLTKLRQANSNKQTHQQGAHMPPFIKGCNTFYPNHSTTNKQGTLAHKWLRSSTPPHPPLQALLNPHSLRHGRP